jgi:uncharacterized membrane protein
MATWYCVVQDNRYGPVSRDVLQGWINEGRIGPNDLVWCEGMPEWVQARTVPELRFSGDVMLATLNGGIAGGVPDEFCGCPNASGSGGQTGVFEILRRSWDRLKGGKWGIAIGFCLLAGLLNYAVSMIGNLMANFIPFLGVLISTGISLILGAMCEMAYAVFFLRIVGRGQPKIEHLFAGFKRFGDTMAIYLWRLLYVFLWTLPWVSLAIFGTVLVLIGRETESVFAVGVILIVLGAAGYVVLSFLVMLRYALVFYLYVDNPTMRPRDTLRRSSELMEGHKLRLLGLMFMGGLIGMAGMLTCCIGLVFAMPWVSTSMAEFYADVLPPNRPGGRRAVTDQVASIE